MRGPAFWHRPPGWQSALLAPLGALYAAATAARVARAPRLSAPVPVICIGNLNAGGTGKTPTAIALIQRLQARGQRPVALSRGHGGSLTGPVTVEPSRHDAAETGDEPLLLAAFAPTVIARDRAAAARHAMALDPTVLLLDDGHQNPDLAKDLTLLTVDAAAGFGNGRTLPAGPLREPVARGLARADLLLSIGQPKAQARFARRWGTAITLPQLTGRLEPLPTGLPWRGLRAFAFAGIGHPEKFFATLRRLGADVAATRSLADHQPLDTALTTRLLREARSLGAQPVTTEKDAVRLPSALRGQVLTLPVRLEIDDPEPLDDALSRLGL